MVFGFGGRRRDKDEENGEQEAKFWKKELDKCVHEKNYWLTQFYGAQRQVRVMEASIALQQERQSGLARQVEALQEMQSKCVCNGVGRMNPMYDARSTATTTSSPRDMDSPGIRILQTQLTSSQARLREADMALMRAEDTIERLKQELQGVRAELACARTTSSAYADESEQLRSQLAAARGLGDDTAGQAQWLAQQLQDTQAATHQLKIDLANREEMLSLLRAQVAEYCPLTSRLPSQGNSGSNTPNHSGFTTLAGALPTTTATPRDTLDLGQALGSFRSLASTRSTAGVWPGGAAGAQPGSQDLNASPSSALPSRPSGEEPSRVGSMRLQVPSLLESVGDGYVSYPAPRMSGDDDTAAPGRELQRQQHSVQLHEAPLDFDAAWASPFTSAQQHAPTPMLASWSSAAPEAAAAGGGVCASQHGAELQSAMAAAAVAGVAGGPAAVAHESVPVGVRPVIPALHLASFSLEGADVDDEEEVVVVEEQAGAGAGAGALLVTPRGQAGQAQQQHAHMLSYANGGDGGDEHGAVEGSPSGGCSVLIASPELGSNSQQAESAPAQGGGGSTGSVGCGEVEGTEAGRWQHHQNGNGKGPDGAGKLGSAGSDESHHVWCCSDTTLVLEQDVESGVSAASKLQPLHQHQHVLKRSVSSKAGQEQPVSCVMLGPDQEAAGGVLSSRVSDPCPQAGSSTTDGLHSQGSNSCVVECDNDDMYNVSKIINRFGGLRGPSAGGVGGGGSSGSSGGGSSGGGAPGAVGALRPMPSFGVSAAQRIKPLVHPVARTGTSGITHRMATTVVNEPAGGLSRAGTLERGEGLEVEGQEG